MSKSQEASEFTRARDRLFSEMQRCGVCNALEDEVEEWLSDTIALFGEQYPSLTQLQLEVLRKVGRNFAAPVVPHGKGNDARDR